MRQPRKKAVVSLREILHALRSRVEAYDHVTHSNLDVYQGSPLPSKILASLKELDALLQRRAGIRDDASAVLALLLNQHIRKEDREAVDKLGRGSYDAVLGQVIINYPLRGENLDFSRVREDFLARYNRDQLISIKREGGQEKQMLLREFTETEGFAEMVRSLSEDVPQRRIFLEYRDCQAQVIDKIDEILRRIE